MSLLCLKNQHGNRFLISCPFIEHYIKIKTFLGLCSIKNSSHNFNDRLILLDVPGLSISPREENSAIV